MADPRPVSISDVSGPGILRLARSSRDAARAKLRGLDPERQVLLCLELRPELRSELLLLIDQPERVVPLLPEAELCATARVGGMSDAAFLLELCTPAQARACLDLDCWAPLRLEVDRALEWLDALVEAGPPTVARLFGEVDPEVWVLALRSITEVAVLGKEDDKPEGWLSVDGMVYWGPREGTDPARVEQLARALFDRSPADYWKLVYGLLFESSAECEEWGLRWRAGRLADLGFPEREQAMQLYRPLRPEDAPVWHYPGAESAVVEQRSLPRQLQSTLLGEALGRLPAQRAGDVLGYVLAVANAVAVADRRRLSESDTVPAALEKAVGGIDRGLRELSKLRGEPPEDVLDRTPPADLFRIAVALDPALKPPPPDPDEEPDGDGSG